MRGVSVRALCLSVILVSGGAAAEAQTTPEQRTVEPDWYEYQISPTEGAPSYEARWNVLDEGGGVMLVCGVGMHIGMSSRSDNLKVLEDLGFYLGDDLVMTGMEFFSDVFRKSDLAKAKANCRSSGKNMSDYASREASLRPTRPYKRN